MSTTVPNLDMTLASEYWRNSYERRVYAVTGNAEVIAIHSRADGSYAAFSPDGHEIGNVSGGADRLQQVPGTGWDLTLANSDVEHYDSAGKLLSITARTGRTTTLSYEVCGLLSTVTDAFGHALVFTNDCSKGRAIAVSLPDGSQIQYGYDQWGRPTSVTYADGKTRTYDYAQAGNSWLLTRVGDEDGSTYATYQYDSSGRVTNSYLGEGANRYGFAYGSNSTSIVDPLGTTTQMGFGASGGAYREVSNSRPCLHCASLAGATYDAQGNPATRTDFKGVQTTFQYDSVRNLETSRTEASGTVRARTFTTQWHPTYRLLTQMEQSGQRTNFTYDANGNVLTQAVTDLATDVTRTTTFTYDTYGRALTVDDQRNDVADVTTYTYYTCSAGSECGEVHTIANALGQTTTFSTYNAHGQPLTFTDPNGVVTTLTYDLRQRLTSRTAGGEQTAFEYWPTGLLKKTTLPDGSFMLYHYDAAHRLIRLEDSAGNSIRYSLDNAGNRTAEDVYDPTGALARRQHQVFDNLSRLWKQVGAADTGAVTTTFVYDGNGNQTDVIAPLGRNTSNQYDELNRLRQVTDPGNGVTQYGYDALDRLVSVTDPRNTTTSYEYNAFGDLKKLTSPDTGITANTYDSGGNLATSTDARGKTGTYAYDALNRITSVTYPDQTISYTYDTGTNGIGRLAGASGVGHALTWNYDVLGRTTSKTQAVDSIAKSLSYGYSGGRLATVTLPSGRVVQCGYADGNIVRVTVDGIPVLSDVRYEPFGPVVGWTWGNGTTTERISDTDGKIKRVESAGGNSYGYDDAFRITNITDLNDSSRSWGYGYDALDRLATANRTGMNLGWAYDANGNRLAQSGSSASTYSIASTNNRLASISGALAHTYTYADSGQVTNVAGVNYVYSDAGRLTGLSGAVTASYVHNALGQRVKKNTGSETTYFIYDEAGNLVGEYDGSGDVIQEIVWLGDIPVATLRDCSCGDAIFYIHTDHLNTPRKITKRSITTVVWRWDSDPFGAGAANTDPDGDGTQFVFNLRFPGQYFDAEAGLHYNYFRDYDPGTGRYAQSDPVGLMGGLNGYVYVGNNPVAYVDSSGLEKIILLPKDDPNYPAAEKMPDDPTICLVISHGSNVTVNHMNAKQLNKRISKVCKPKQPVKLDACNAGKGENSIAEQLAKLRKSRVTAPDDRIWTTPWDTELDTPYPPISEDKDSFLNNWPNYARPGDWRDFGPKGPAL